MSKPSLRILGVMGILAASLMLAADCVVMDSSTSGRAFGKVWLSRLIESPNWQLTLGGVGGPIAACVFVFGFAHVYLALQSGGRYWALVCATGFGCGYVILGAWHAIAPLLAFIHRLKPGFDSPHLIDFLTYMQTLGSVGVVPMVSSLILLPILIVVRKSQYPRWFALINPGLIYSLCMVMFAYVPAPIGGYLVIGNGSLSFLVFFVLSTIVLWNVSDASDQPPSGSVTDISEKRRQ